MFPYNKQNIPQSIFIRERERERERDRGNKKRGRVSGTHGHNDVNCNGRAGAYFWSL